MLVFLAALLLYGTAPALAQDSSQSENPSTRWTDSQKFSYILGTQLGQLNRTGELTLDEELIIRGLNDFTRNDDLLMSPQEIQIFMADMQRKEQEKQMAAMNAAATENLKKGQVYLEANKKKKGVKVTSSGLQYRVIKEGDGPTPTASDKVKVHYRGTLIDDTEFDSSYERGQPALFGVSQVIKGWVEGLQLMNVGSKYVLYIPESLAYGKNGPPSIGPSQTLIFEVELLEIIK
ncbi:MAG: FKBP-type peptidyl-prolyl cis-trans isomerase [Deltaproteobacteria bacterium]|nr:FKBP-type peptidyl-prolyl cis-trans isomerase [Deltaproteobacteria bacterium]